MMVLNASLGDAAGIFFGIFIFMIVLLFGIKFVSLCFKAGKKLVKKIEE